MRFVGDYCGCWEWKAFAQYNNNFWVFGDSCGIEFNNGSTSNFKSSMKMLRGAASISNAIGLKAYSSRSDFFIPVNGKVWNLYHQQMSNGDLIYGSGWYHERLFLPVPGSDSLFICLMRYFQFQFLDCFHFD
ncbi:MAG: hypothetical protein IPM91_14820 [Bacteroidetes bacterium]|nr:hypothetical protein [Bacteroidota bacterium]